MFTLRLLGGLTLEGPSGPVSGRVAQRRRLALLALLGVAGEKGLSRDKLAGYLWPESDETSAKHLLSDSLYVLRKELGEEAILASGEYLRLNSALVECDVSTFEAALEGKRFEEALSVYAGPFLDGFYLGGEGEFDAWVETERQRLAEDHAGALEAAAQQAQAAGDLKSAVEWWKKLAADDPYNSRVMLRLMEALTAAGDPANALELMRVHELRLRDELGLELPEDLRTFAQGLRAEPAAEQAAVRGPPRTVPQPAPSVRVAPDGEAPRPLGAPPGWRRWVHEIHRRSLWQVLLVYCGAALIAYQAVQALTEGLGLPLWFPALAIVLFIAGLPIVLATAFVQESAPAIAKPEEPTDLAAADAAGIESEAAAVRIDTGRGLRFLTWRNAAATFVVALAVWGVVLTGWLTFGGRAAGTEDERKSIAVLPFENLSPDSDDAYFADGIHDEIISQLGKIASLKVISRTSVMEYKDRDENLRTIADELGVTHVLQGAVRRVGNRVRITTQLIVAEEDAHLWAENYERELSDIFAIQADVARKVVTALRATLTPEELERIETRPTDNLEAYEYYLRGLEYLRRSLVEEDVLAAAKMLEHAVALDPSFAAAWARLSMVPVRLHWMFYRPFDHVRAREALDRAVQIAPDAVETWKARGFFYYYGLREYDRALEVFSALLDAHPGDAEVLAYVGYLQRRKGLWEQSLSTVEGSLQLDPRNAGRLFNQALSYQSLGRYQEAERYFDLSLALAPEIPATSLGKAQLYLAWDGSTGKAWRVLEQASQRIGLVRLARRGLDVVRIFPDEFASAFNGITLGASGIDTVSYFLAKAELAVLQGESALAQAVYDSARVALEVRVQDTANPQWVGQLALAYAGVGREVEAVRQARRALELEPVSKDAFNGTGHITTLAQVYVRIGECDAAIDQLEQLLSMPSRNSSHLLRLDPIWGPLRDHPRFQALLEKHEPRD